MKKVWEMLKEIISEWQENKAARLAAALAYYTMFSLAPLIIIILAIAGMLIDPSQLETYLTQQAQGLIGPDGANIITSVAENASRPSSILILLFWVYYSAQILLFGAEFTQVYARRFGSRITPSEGAIRVVSHVEAG